MSAAARRTAWPYALGLLVVALVVGMGVSAFASGAPDGLESAIVKSQCADAADQDACLEQAMGESVYTNAPSRLADYEVGWLSGLIGVVASFAVGAGALLLVRWRRQSTGNSPAARTR